MNLGIKKHSKPKKVKYKKYKIIVTQLNYFLNKRKTCTLIKNKDINNTLAKLNLTNS